ncbi:MAG TPA: PAS domain S-box protein [Opitutaceae bacterium]
MSNSCASRLRQEHFEAAVHNALDIIAVLNAGGLVEFVSPSVERILGYAPAELVDESVFDFIHTDQHSEVREAINAIVGEPGRVVSIECSVRHKGGSWRTVMATGQTLKPDNPSAGILVNAHDITELRESEDRFRAVVEQAISGIYIIQDGAFVYVNPRFVEIFGYNSAEEIIGRTPLDLTAEPDRAVVAENIRRRLNGETKSIAYTFRGLRADGSSVDIGAHGTLASYKGRAAIVGVLQDISERQRALNALQASEERYRTLAENLAELIYRADPETLKPTYVNRAVERVYGYSAVEWISDPSLRAESIHPQDRERVLRAFGEAQARTEDRELEYRVVSRDGELRWVVDRFVWEKNPAGDVVSVSGVISDVTNRKESEKALRKTNRALRTLSAGNEAMVRAEDEAGLLRDMCRAIIEAGAYRLAAVSYVQNGDALSVLPQASAGVDLEEMQSLPMVQLSRERPGVLAGRDGRTHLTGDARVDPRFAPWRAFNEQHDIASILELPLLNGDSERPYGALYIASSEPEAFDPDEIKLLEELSIKLAYGIAHLRVRAENDAAAAHLRKVLEDSIQAIAGTVEMRDPYTAGHERRVADLAAAIGRELNLPEATVEGIHFGALVHDVGKLYVPAEILAKPRRLSPVEFELIKIHSQAGYEILKDIDFPWPIAQMVLQHHERLDGSGYPQGLKGDEIILEARILAVADTVEAMSSHRPYRPGLGIDQALAEIEKHRGTTYDARAVDACLRLVREKGYQFPA